MNYPWGYSEFLDALMSGSGAFDYMTRQKKYAQEVLMLSDRDTQDYLNNDPIYGFHVNYIPQPMFDDVLFTAFMTGRICPDHDLHRRRLDKRCIKNSK